MRIGQAIKILHFLDSERWTDQERAMALIIVCFSKDNERIAHNLTKVELVNAFRWFFGWLISNMFKEVQDEEK